MDLISLKNIKFKYEKSNSLVLDDISFSIKKGSYTAIVGTNGSGKSTIARIICGLNNVISGNVNFSEKIKIGIVFQSPKNQIVSSIVYRDTSFGPQTQNLPKSEIELRTIECLNVVDLLSHAESGTAELSLGQVQKTALAGMLACEPDVLIMDEALSMIDPKTREEIFEFLRYWHKKGKTILHITHDEDALNDVENIICIQNGKIFFNGSKDEFLSDEKNRILVAGNKIPKTDKTFLQKKLDKAISLKLSDVSFFYNKKYGVRNINFELYKGSITALTGESGSGKSTILEICAGLNCDYQGKIFCTNPPVLAQQNSSSALFEAFASDDVAFGPENQGKTGKELLKIVKESMNSSGIPFEQFKERHTFELSGGEQRRLSIAGIIALNSDVILFDEPTAGLDAFSKELVLKMFRELAENGKTILFSSHHQDEIDFADREIQISNGIIIKDTCKSYEKDFISPKKTCSELKEQKSYSASKIINTLRKTSSSIGKTSVNKKNVIQKLHPSLRILLFLLMFTISLVLKSVFASSIIFFVTIFYALVSGFKIKNLFSSFLKILPFLLFFTILQLIFKSPLQNEIYFTNWKFLTITPSKLWFCLNSLVRTYSAISCICAFFVSTSEYDLIDGLKILLFPLEKIKIPTRYFILIIEIIFRFIPLLIEETSSIIKTQIIRGNMKNVKGTWGKIKALVPLLVPIIIQTIKRSEALADAITMRGF